MTTFGAWFHRQSLGTHLALLGMLHLFSTVLVLSIIVVFVTSQLHTFRQKEAQRFSQSIDVSIQEEEDRQNTFMYDYAVWDDMATAIQNNDLDWLNETFVGTLETFNIQGLWVTTQDTLMYRRFDEKYGEVVLPPGSIPTDGELTKAFFHWQGENLFRFTIVQIRPHTASNSEGSGAYMISAKHWDEEVVSHLSALSQSTVRITTDIEEEVSRYEHRIVKILPTYTEFSEHAVIEYRRENTVFILLTQTLIVAVLLFASTRIPLFLLQFLMQRRWILTPISQIHAHISEHIGLLPKGLQSTKNELQMLSALTAEYSRQEGFVEQSAGLLEKQKKELFIANQKIKEELLHHERLSLVVEKSTNGVLITDAHQKILYVNPSWEQLNGYTASDVLGKTPSVVQSGKTPESEYKKMWNALSQGKSFTSEEIINRRKDGKDWECRLSVYPIQEENRTINFVGIQQNISKRKEVDRMKTDFISLASHQLRTPLTAMRWFSELLLKNTQSNLTDDQKDLLFNLHTSTLRMISLVNMLLNISRIESGRLLVEPKDTDLRLLSDSVIEELNPRLAEKKIRVEKDYEQHLPIVFVDAQLIREVFANLLTNALKYSPENTQIRVSVFVENEFIHVSVCDQGIGIPKDDQDKIFTKFYRGSNVMSTETDGTGLGLYFVKEIVETSKGKIWFESGEGKGTTFHFTVPLEGMAKKTGEVTITPT